MNPSSSAGSQSSFIRDFASSLVSFSPRLVRRRNSSGQAWCCRHSCRKASGSQQSRGNLPGPCCPCRPCTWGRHRPWSTSSVPWPRFLRSQRWS